MVILCCRIRGGSREVKGVRTSSLALGLVGGGFFSMPERVNGGDFGIELAVKLTAKQRASYERRHCGSICVCNAKNGGAG